MSPKTPSLAPKTTTSATNTSTGQAINPARFRAQAAGAGMGCVAKTLCIDRRKASPPPMDEADTDSGPESTY